MYINALITLYPGFIRHKEKKPRWRPHALTIPSGNLTSVSSISSSFDTAVCEQGFSLSPDCPRASADCLTNKCESTGGVTSQFYPAGGPLDTSSAAGAGRGPPHHASPARSLLSPPSFPSSSPLWMFSPLRIVYTYTHTHFHNNKSYKVCVCVWGD